MIEVRKIKSGDAVQVNPAIKYVVKLGGNTQYLTEKALIELKGKLNTFVLNNINEHDEYSIFSKEELLTIKTDILHVYDKCSLDELEVHKRNLILNKIKKNEN